MYSRKFRIRKKEIVNVVKQGKRFSSNHFDIKVWYDNSLAHHQFAVIVPKKVSRLATSRNKIKRNSKIALVNLMNNGKLKMGKYILLVRSEEIINDNGSSLYTKIFAMLN